MKTIVSLGIGGRYPKLLERLRESCLKYKLPHILWHTYPPGSRSHHISPYGFKVHAIMNAVQQGFKTIIWADSAAYLVKDPSSFFQLVKEKGIVFLGRGDRLVQWVNDRSLIYFGFKRNALEKEWLCSGTVFGFDFTHQVANDFLNELLAYEKNDWFKEDSQKPGNEFLSHRHDEAIMSLMLMKYNIEQVNAYDHINGGYSDTFKAGKDI